VIFPTGGSGMALPLVLPGFPVSAYGKTRFLALRRGPLYDDKCCEDAGAAACHCPHCCLHLSFAFSCLMNLLWQEAVLPSKN
jgi:hypothetical protein